MVFDLCEKVIANNGGWKRMGRVISDIANIVKARIFTHLVTKQRYATSVSTEASANECEDSLRRLASLASLHGEIQ